MQTKIKSIKLTLLVFVVAMASIAQVLLMPQPAAAACQTPTPNYGTVSATVSMPGTANYRIWTRIMVPDATNNSYLLEIDGNQCYSVGGGSIPTSTWTWVDYRDGNTATKNTLSLSQGNHTFKLIGSKPDVKIDRLVLTSDLSCVPTGNGDNCNTPTDTTNPTVSLTAPANGSKVSGTVAITATASDNVGITKVEFFDNSTLLRSDATAPYDVNWDTTKTNNGTHTLTAKAFDAAGNNVASTRTVTVDNGSSAPYVWQPTGLTIMDEGKNTVMGTDYLHKGERLFVSITGKNMGTQTWQRGGSNPAFLGTSSPMDHRSEYCDALWLQFSPRCNRAARLVESSVAPGGTFHFETYIHAPNQGGEFREHFTPVLEGKSWMTNNAGFHIYVNSTDFYDWRWLYFDAWTSSSKSTRVNMSNLARNQQVYLELKIKNTSATVWRKGGSTPTRLGTQKPQDHNSFLCAPSWPSCNRPSSMVENEVKPGQTATFGFTIKVPGSTGEYREYLKPLIEFKGWMRGDDNHIYMKVTH